MVMEEEEVAFSPKEDTNYPHIIVGGSTDDKKDTGRFLLLTYYLGYEPATKMRLLSGGMGNGKS
jgi:hypothetical protein